MISSQVDVSVCNIKCDHVCLHKQTKSTKPECLIGPDDTPTRVSLPKERLHMILSINMTKAMRDGILFGVP